MYECELQSLTFHVVKKRILIIVDFKAVTPSKFTLVHFKEGPPDIVVLFMQSRVLFGYTLRPLKFSKVYNRLKESTQETS